MRARAQNLPNIWPFIAFAHAPAHAPADALYSQERAQVYGLWRVP